MVWGRKKTPPAVDKPRWNQDDYHKEFAGKLKEQIEQGVAPWQKPWKPGESRLPKNIQTDKPYRGGNSVYLSVTQTAKGYSDNRWATYKQISEMGGQVRKGEKSTHVLFYKFDDEKEKGAALLVGAARVLRRSELLRQLRKYRARAAYRGEEQRRARLVSELRTARLTGIRIAVPVEALEARLAGLPEGRDGRAGPDRGAVRGREGGRGEAVRAGAGADERLRAVRDDRRQGGEVGMSEALAPVVAVDRPEIARPGAAAVVLPEVIVDAGPAAVERFLEFFAAAIANDRTRAAYGQAAGQFLGWCGARGLGLRAIAPLHVAAYIRTHPGSVPTVKQHLAAIRALLDWLVVHQVLPVNPAASVRGPKHVVTKGATPVLTPAETRSLLDRIDTGTLVGLRDRALLSVLVYSFARVSAAVGMRRQDYFRQGTRGWLRLHEKGGKRHDVPAHHRAEEALEAYLAAAGGVDDDAKAPLFQSVDRTGGLSGRPLGRRVVLAMIKRRAVAAGLPATTCCHTFRATGITAYLSNGGTLEHAQRIAGHASPKTTKLYDRTADTITLDEIERIVI